MNKEEYNDFLELLRYTKALKLLLEWAKQCDFGLDNIAYDLMGTEWNDEIITEKEFMEQTKNRTYTESMIYYADIYLHKSDEPLCQRIQDADIDQFKIKQTGGIGK